MTLQSTKQLIEKYYEAIMAQDLVGFLSLLSDNVIHDINQGPTEVGKPLFKQFMQRIFEYDKETFKDFIILISPDGKYAATRFKTAGKYTKSTEGCPPAKGQKWEIPVTSFFEIENDQISRVTVHYNMQEWIAQVS